MAAFLMYMDKKYFTAQNIIRNVIVTAATFLVAVIGLFFTFKEFVWISVWIPSGLLFAAYIMYGRVITPAIVLSSVLVTLTLAPFRGPILYAVMVANAVILTSALLTGGGFFSRHIHSEDFYKQPDLVIRYILIVLAMSAFSAVFGMTTRLILLDLPLNRAMMIFYKWLLADLLSYLIITPLIFTVKHNRKIDFDFGAYVELISMIILSFLLISLMFASDSRHPFYMALPYLIIPLIIWSAFRFSEREAMLTALLVSVVSSWSAVKDYGPFDFGDPDISLINAQLYLVVIALIALTTASIVRAHRDTAEAMKNVSKSLEKRVAKRTHELANLNKELLIEVNNRKRIEKALKENENKLSFILNNVNDGIFTLNTKGEFLFSTPSVNTLFMFHCQKKTHQFLQFVDKKDRSAVKKSYQRILSGEISVGQLEYRVSCGNKEIWHATTLTREIDQEGNVVLIGVCKDISRQKAAEAEKQLLEEQVRNAAKLESLGVLAGGIAHDFNNMLTAIMGNCGLAKMQVPQTSKAGRHLENIEKASVKAADLCQQLLAYSGKGKFIVQELNINEIMRDMMNLLKVSISPKIDISFDFKADLPAIKADAAQIQQIIMNVITNASEAIGDQPGKIHIKTDRLYCDRKQLDNYYMGHKLSEGYYVLMEVSDSGHGMDEATLEKIFDPFFTTKFTGRGLGLAAVLGILRAHEASVNIRSEPGKGTTFTFIFPEYSQEQGAHTTESGPETNTDRWELQGTVLLVDDDEAIREISRQTLEQAGLHVVTADNGQKAVEIYSQSPDKIKLVLMDMTMPRLNGREAMELMRQINQNVQVILSSGYSEQDATKKIKEKGLLGFLQKPYKPDDLLRTIKPFLSAV